MTNDQKIYTLEIYRTPYDRTRKVTTHKGRADENRDAFSPGMIRAREYYAANQREAWQKARAVAKALSAEGPRHTFTR